MNLPIRHLQRYALELHDQLLLEVANRLAAVLAETSAERVESPELVAQIENQISKIGDTELIKQAAYTWFNRAIALRFMDVNQYNAVKIVSPAQGVAGLPDVLLRAKTGNLKDTGITSIAVHNRVKGLLEGAISPRSGWAVDQEAYRLLLIAKCNELSESMPYLFEKVSKYLALLLPQDLLSPNSFLNKTAATLSQAVCSDVEVIGWLYQFYISSEKEEAFARIKKGSKAKSSDIPAITQLFTPHYIVKYLAQNSVGRIWLQNNPSSQLRESLDFLIAEQESGEFKKLESPKDLTVLDPAVGSGHLLTYVFDILYEIYLEAGYDKGEIPQAIIRFNLFGIEIDPRAAALASFALVMKATSFDPVFLSRGVLPNISVIRNIDLSNEAVLAFDPRFEAFLKPKERKNFFSSFVSADSLGSMIRFSRDEVEEASRIASEVEDDNTLIANSLRVFLSQAKMLSNRFVCVIANPPYIGYKKMDKPLAGYLTQNFNDSKSDLCIAFIERSLQLTVHGGYSAMLTMQSWMHQDSFARFRRKLMLGHNVSNVLHLGPHAFDSIGGEVVTTAATVIQNRASTPKSPMVFFNLSAGKSESEKVQLLESAQLENLQTVRTRDFFESFPEMQLFYGLDENLALAMSSGSILANSADFIYGLVTADNDRFIRLWHEIDFTKFKKPVHSLGEDYSNAQWVSLVKGGGARRWYGNHEHVIKWDPKSKSSFAAISGLQNYFKPGGTWSSISNELNVRFLSAGHAVDHAGPAFTPLSPQMSAEDIVGLLNSGPIRKLAEILGPGGKKSIGHVSSIPIPDSVTNTMPSIRIAALEAIQISETDWNSVETSWGFQASPLLGLEHDGRLSIALEKYLAECGQLTLRMGELEHEISAHYASAYGLSVDDYPMTSMGHPTLFANSRWVYKSGNQENREEKFRLSLVKDLISYAVGCMFGRYSLDAPGIVISNTSDEESYFQSNSNKNIRFSADRDNILTLLEDDSFEDDVITQFRLFLKTAFGELHYEQNISLIESILGKDLRKYFAKDFYPDHLQKYQNRPIYWMCTSPSGKFKALFYVHRYKPSLFATLRSQYLISYREKLEARIEAMVATGAGNPEPLRSTLVELSDFDQKVIHNLSIKSINLNTDDGVKVNYGKFGKALNPIKGIKNDE